MLSTAYIALDRAVDSAIGKVPLLQRRELRRVMVINRSGILRDAFRSYRANKDDKAPVLAEDAEDSERPLIDLWRYIIESGKLQLFLTFLVQEFLPALFAVILQLIDALSAVNQPAPAAADTNA